MSGTPRRYGWPGNVIPLAVPVSDRVKNFNQMADKNNEPLHKARSVDTVCPSYQSSAGSSYGTRGTQSMMKSYKSVANLDKHVMFGLPFYAPQRNDAPTTNNALKRQDSGFDSSLKLDRTGDDELDRTEDDKGLSQRSLQNIAFLSGVPTEHRSQKPYSDTRASFGHAPMNSDVEAHMQTEGNKSYSNSRLDKNAEWCATVKDDRYGSKHLPSDSKWYMHGNSKQRVERKKMDLKLSPSTDKDTNSPEHDANKCYTPTYIKSPTRNTRPKSMASFPPVFELPDETVNDVEKTQITKQTLHHSAHLSKSDSHLQRRYSESDQSTVQTVHHFRDCHVMIGSTNNLTHSSEAISCLSSYSNQINERKNIIESTRETLEEYLEDEKIRRKGLDDLELRRFQNAKSIIEKTGLLIIRCGDKDGSTHLGYSLMVLNQGSTPCIIGDITEYTACIAGGDDKYTFLVDDPLGHVGQDINTWSSHLERNSTKRQRGSLRMIFIVKDKGLSPGCDFLQRYQESVLDLSQTTNSLTNIEKAHLLRRSIKLKNSKRRQNKINLEDNEIHRIAEAATSFGYFGLIADFLSSEDSIELGPKALHVPSINLYRKIHQMKDSSDDIEKSMYVALAAAYFFKGGLSKDHIAMFSRRLSIDVSPSRTNTRSSTEFLNCSGNSRRKNKNTIQPQIDVSSYDSLMELATSLNLLASFGKRLNDGVKRLEGTFLYEDSVTLVYKFSSPSIENAIALSLGQVYPQEIIATCTKEFFHDYVGTDMSFQDNEERCIKLDIGTKESYAKSFERLRNALDENECEYFVSHPMVRDARFLEILSERWNEKLLYERFLSFFWSSKKKGLAETLMNMTDKHGKSILIYSLDFPFFEGSTTQDCQSIADWILCRKKWKDLKHENKEHAFDVENTVIQHSCEEKWEDVYLRLVDELNLNKGRYQAEWLYAAVRSGSVAIVQDILDVDPRFAEDVYFKVTERALSAYMRHQTSERKHILINVSKKSSISSLVLSIGKSGCERSLVTIKLVFELDINANNLTRDGPMIFVLVKYDKLYLFQVLLGAQFRANPRIIHKGQMCVHRAAELGRSRFLQILVQLDESLAHEKNIDGKTPLHLAAQHGHINCVLYLLHVGVKVNERDHSGQTALHKAAKLPGAELTHILVKGAGADVYAKDRCRKTTIDIARQSKNDKAVSIMIGRQKRLVLPDTTVKDVRYLFK